MARITVYALSTCPYCHQARALLTEKAADFDVIEVDKLEGAERDAAVAEVKRLSGAARFPVTVSGERVVVGFDAAGLERLVQG
jgi:glutaredoxin-like protein NrdH